MAKKPASPQSPIVSAYSFERQSDGWVAVRYDIQDGVIIDTFYSPPDSCDISFQKAAVDYSRYCMKQWANRQ